MDSEYSITERTPAKTTGRTWPVTRRCGLEWKTAGTAVVVWLTAQTVQFWVLLLPAGWEWRSCAKPAAKRIRTQARAAHCTARV